MTKELKNRVLENKVLTCAERMKIIKALERDTPMKVNIQHIYTLCPNGCGYELSTHHGDGYYTIDRKPTFCPKCGQRLDWEEEDD